MKTSNTIKNVMIIGVMLCFASGSLAAEAYFTGLGDLPGGGTGSAAWGVSADGSVIVGYSLSTSGNQAFRWTQEEGMIGLGNLPGGYVSAAENASADGSVIVGSAFATPGPEAFRWTQEEGMVGLGNLPSGIRSWFAMGVSDDGSVIVGDGRITGSVYEAFRWTAGEGMAGLGDLPGGSFASAASGVSGDGSVIVGGGSSEASNEKFNEAFRWTQQEGMVGLGDLPGGIFGSYATSVSGDGCVIVGAGSSASSNEKFNEAFRWTQEEGMVGLGDLPGGSFYSAALDVSGDGSVIVGVSEGPGADAAFIWDIKHGMRDLKDVLVNEYSLDLSGWKLLSAQGVSHDGKTIVGHGTYPRRLRQGWVARLPETITLSLDIKPGSCPNPINTNTRSKGKLPMVILGTESFEVSEIDVESISINDTVFPVQMPNIEDVGTVIDSEECGCHSAGADGFDDLVIHFYKRETIVTLGLDQMEPGIIVPITVEGELIDGTPFEATDCVTIVPRND
ncbi:MAG: hypothetical protein ACYTA5_03490 [Planctomycetota bacterium]|jgi:probable HAF family extracellular repeat protein